MVVVIPVYSEHDLNPRAMQVIRNVVDEAFGKDEVRFKTLDWSDKKVLVFGKAPSHFRIDAEFIYTYSIPQVMTKANAATVIAAGVRQFVNVPEKIPFVSPVFTSNPMLILSEIDPHAPIAVDIETSGLLGKTHTPEEVGLLSVAFYQAGMRYPIVLVSRTESGTDDGTVVFDASERYGIQQLLLAPHKPIYHNGKFDIGVLNRILDVKLTNWFDTMLAHHVLNHAAGDHKLKTCARRYLGAPEWEKDLGKYTKGGGHYELIPRKLLVEYNGWDVYWTYKFWEFLAPQIEADPQAEAAFYFEMQAADFLLDVEAYGIPFDNHYADLYGKILLTEAEAWKDRLRDAADNPEFNPNSPKQVKEAFSAMGLEISSTDEATMQGIIDSYGPGTDVGLFASRLLSFRKCMKKHGTYVKGWTNASRHGRVHPTFLVHGTSTGRLSSTGPNAQNVPREKEVRKLVKTHG